MRKGSDHTLSAKFLPLVSSKLLRANQQSNLWTEFSSFVKMSFASFQASSLSDHTLLFSNNVSTSSGSVTTDSQSREIKPSCLAKHHPYRRHFSINRTSSSRSGYHNTKMARFSHSRRSLEVDTGHGKTKCTKNMFLEGFQDCASEVLRFLRQVEHVEDSNPLIQGLQSHLSKISCAICPENTTDLDTNSASPLQISPVLLSHKSQNQTVRKCREVTLNRNLDEHNNAKVFECHPNFINSTYLLSPVLTASMADSNSTRLSESSSGVESDVWLFSTSVQADSEKSHQIREIINSDLNNSGEFYEHFYSDSSTTDASRLHPRARSAISMSSMSVTSSAEYPHIQLKSPPSLAHLSSVAIDRNITCHQAGLIGGSCQCLSSSSSPTDINSRLTFSKLCHSSRIPPLSCNTNNLSPKDRKGHPIQSFSERLSSAASLPLITLLNSKQTCSSAVKHLSTEFIPEETMFEQLKNNEFDARKPAVSSFNTVEMHSDSDPAVTWCQQPPKLSASSLILLASQPALLPVMHMTHKTDSDSMLRAPTANSCPDQLQQVSSVLELRPNFFPGVDSSSVASGDFADVLLAVESCRSHEDIRVRSLAEEIICLIHNDADVEGDSEDDDEIYNEESDDEDFHGNESGIEMDDGSNWGNPADLIEQ
ncbi:hypothetical protein PoB_003556100 [Plakobranchus ocellatus]|uniref:Orange domain-containing protein n=1 Tax=Plakobranchus ocellatus TaxID=259542 RepID=A0AAV4AD43_9GAST|nr:hypothetical protein PoB_003556100 [Plakobranchus ocellatus]